MINLPASQLSLKLTKEEKENLQAMTIWNAYKKELSNANDMKLIYKKCKKAIKSGIIEFESSRNIVKVEEAKSAEKYFYNEAIKSWNKAQKLLADFNEFEENRKYKKIY
jgi:hypothetical protein